MIISVLKCAVAASAQTNDSSILQKIQALPSFTITAVPDSSIFSSGTLQKNKPVVLIFFNPDCEHCQHEMKELLAYKEELKDIQIVMATALPYKLANEFYKDYNVASMPNVKMGQDVNYVLGIRYHPTRYPAIYVYDAAGKLAKVFAGNAEVPAIINAVKE